MYPRPCWSFPLFSCAITAVLLARTTLAQTDATAGNDRRFDRVTLSTGVISRTLAVEQGCLTTTEIANLATGRQMPLAVRSAASAPEFAVRLVSGVALTTKDYRVLGRQTTHDRRRHEEIFDLIPKNPIYPRVRVAYSAKRGDHFLRKRIEIEPGNGEEIVDAVSVEAIPVRGRLELGGFGQPLLIDDQWFAGLEYPGGTNTFHNGLVTCTHHPGRSTLVSKSAVVGGIQSPGARVDDAFEQYLETIRLPPRTSLQYNGWFDRRGDEITPDSMQSTFRIFSKNLLEPFDLHFDAFVIDDGYQEPDSVWECSHQWPHGLAPFARQLEARRSRLGLWLPLNGYHLNTAWGVEKGFEQSDHRKGYYCLAGPRYQSAIRAALVRRIRDGNLSYLKHDFNFLHCGAKGHGHLPTDRHGLEASLDAQLELLAFEREVQPGIFLNVTSNVWPSPWWLQHADTIWMGSADYDHEWEQPAWSDREAEMTYRDARLFNLIHMQRAQVPVADLMTHGIICGRHAGVHPSETLKQWADYVMLYFGRGTRLHELYISPDLLPEGYWSVLGKAIRWAQANEKTMRHTRMIGGRPQEGEVYGFIHWSPHKGILCVRNPSQRPKKFSLLDDHRPLHLTERRRWHPVIVYPHQERLAAVSGAPPLTLMLPSASVTVIELYAELPPVLENLPVGRFHLSHNGSLPTLTTYSSPPPVNVLAAKPIDDRKKEWHGRFRMTSPAPLQAALLSVIRHPPRSAVMKVAHGAVGLSPVEDRTSPDVRDWDITRYSIPLDTQGDIRIDGSLPPTPFWPERAVCWAVLQTQTRHSVVDERVLPSDVEPPRWPMVATPDTMIEEHILVAGKTLRRRRSLAESLAWVLLLGVVPPTIAVRFGRWVLPSRTFLGPLLAIGSVVALYVVTPLGYALARVLH